MTVEKRYAEGFLDYAKETIGFDKGLEELNGVKNVFQDSPEFLSFLENPAINYAEKCDTIEAVFAKSFSQETRQFLKLLLKKRRIELIVAIEEYARVKYAHGEEIAALLNSSYPLDTEDVRSIKDVLEKKMMKKLHLYMDLNPELLGGVRATIGNIVIDGSVKKRLEDLREKLMAAKVV